MSRKELYRVIIAFWIALSAACNPAPPAAVTATVTPTTISAGMPTDVPLPVSGCEAEEINLQDYRSVELQNPEEIASEGGILDATLEVKYGNNHIANCPVQLRSYNGKLVGPTLRARPGDKMILHIKNMLPPNPHGDDHGMNIPHDFNTTNLHTHGLHVSPEGISDNVLRKMPPPAAGASEADYEVVIDIPADHPAGTFWYHPHVHGSTAMQVSSGMAGALIIEGGLDEAQEIAAAEEKIFVLQQIAYDTGGKIESFETSLGFKQWEELGRHHTINGQLFPTLTMRPGELQRWRLIHAGIEETIEATLYGPGCDNPMDFDAITRLPKNTLNEIAVDGLSLGKLDGWLHIRLEPGYRSDVLVRLERPGNYCLVDDFTAEEDSLRGEAEAGEAIARIQVTDDPLPQPMLFPKTAELAPLKPFKDITPEEITGHQTVAFCLCFVNGQLTYTVNGKEFDETQVRKLKLNAVEEWDVSVHVEPNSIVKVKTHPFHIHVNPFQVTRAGPDGKPETVWRDTFLVTSQDPNNPQRLLMRYKDFTGKFVMHCHILDHEDQGMMEVEEVVP